MKAVIASSGEQAWQLQDVPVPEPAENQVLIRVHASGVCYNDLHQSRGTPGHEPAGEIVAVGPGVRSRCVGDRVGVLLWQSACGRCEWCQRDKPLFCSHIVGTSMHLPGSHAEYMLAYADATVLLPEGLTYEQAAPLFCAGYTAYAGLRAADPRPGETVAVVGIGGLGHLAVQYAKASGFRTIAVTQSTDKETPISDLGADEIVRDGRALAAVGGADVVLGTSRSMSAQSDAMQGLRPEGRMVIMGLGSAPLEVSAGQLIMKRARIVGSQHNGREYLYQVLDFAARGKVTAVTESYDLAEAAAVRERLLEGAVRFRAVLVM
ncbi:alcohol dehydrogenase [Alkalilimnicola ehrlichii]|nr:alcohol dehydrogenase [Alkalilimnicola ehrlichii]